uniref:Uncharacterized protein n=1 Tax=Nelumbo nucifera TaxID=4432 RepID=A0A822Y0P3_NELNU|nr:TPA_asm: hypothetical protein HUJ06_026280 [Nelumbo nucifera]
MVIEEMIAQTVSQPYCLAESLMSSSSGQPQFRYTQTFMEEEVGQFVMMHGRNNGKKLMAIHIVKKAMETIHVLTDKKKPYSKDETRIGSSAIVNRQAVDISPLKRCSFRNMKSMAECLADEIINAKKDEIDRAAKANR